MNLSKNKANNTVINILRRFSFVMFFISIKIQYILSFEQEIKMVTILFKDTIHFLIWFYLLPLPH